MAYMVKFGRTDGSALKYCTFKSRVRALSFANSIAYVLFYQHSFKSSACQETVRVELNNFYVEFSESGQEAALATPTSGNRMSASLMHP